MSVAPAASKGDGESKDLSPFLLFLLACAYLLNSSGLIAFNKYLMHVDRFPYRIVLVMLHMGFCSIGRGLLFPFKPPLSPALAREEKKDDEDGEITEETKDSAGKKSFLPPNLQKFMRWIVSYSCIVAAILGTTDIEQYGYT